MRTRPMPCTGAYLWRVWSVAGCRSTGYAARLTTTFLAPMPRQSWVMVHAGAAHKFEKCFINIYILSVWQDSFLHFECIVVCYRACFLRLVVQLCKSYCFTDQHCFPNCNFPRNLQEKKITIKRHIREMPRCVMVCLWSLFMGGGFLFRANHNTILEPYLVL